MKIKTYREKYIDEERENIKKIFNKYGIKIELIKEMEKNGVVTIELPNIDAQIMMMNELNENETIAALSLEPNKLTLSIELMI